MDGETQAIREDFDRLARLSDADARGPYDDFLLTQLPPACERVLEVGCGAGGFARRLARRARRVVAIDLSPAMIAAARARGCDNIEYVVGDARDWAFPDGEFDCAVSIAALHHLPFEATLAAMARSLVAGGRLLVHDLFADHGLRDRLLGVAALVVSRLTSRRSSAAVRAAWAAHAQHDHFMTLPEIRARAERVLPGARVRRHLRWRYTLTWRRGAE